MFLKKGFCTLPTMNNYSLNISFSVIIFITFICNSLWAQNDSKLSIFNYNPLLFNPAFAGSADGFYAIGIYSTQWYGFEGAPNTQFLSAHTKLPQSKTGLGLSFYNDIAGPVREYNIEGNYAHYATLSHKYKISLGLKVGLHSNILDVNLLKRLHPEEDIYGYDKVQNLTPIVGVGMNLYDEKFYLGISTPNLLSTKYYNPNYSYIYAKTKGYYYLTTGYKMDLDLEFTLTPTLLFRITEGAPISAMTSFNLNWQNKYIGGINFEYNSSIGGFFGIAVLKNFKAGYAYDYSLNNFSNYNSGSHTFFLSYTLENNDSEKCSCHIY